jgi:hypothetical protein
MATATLDLEPDFLVESPMTKKPPGKPRAQINFQPIDDMLPRMERIHEVLGCATVPDLVRRIISEHLAEYERLYAEELRRREAAAASLPTGHCSGRKKGGKP